MHDNVALLRSLAIDRVAQSRPARRPSLIRAAFSALAVCALVAGLGLVWFVAPRSPAVGQLDRPASIQSPPAELPAAALDPRRPGDLAASGYVVARRKATIASEITGKVVESLVDEGMAVDAGQVLARLDSTLAKTDLALAKSRVVASDAAVAAIAADLRDAERIFHRTQSLSQSRFASEADLTKAEARVGVLRAQLGQGEAQLQTARLDAQRSADVLEQHQIRAPFSGVVVDRSAQPGEMISPLSAGGGFTRTGICTIVDMDSIEIEVDVNEAYIGRVRPAGTVTAVLDAYPNWTIPASVIAIVPTADRNKATVKVRVGLKQKDPRILPDMGIKVQFIDDSSSLTGGAPAETPSTAD